jgi:hypothetical protein
MKKIAYMLLLIGFAWILLVSLGILTDRSLGKYLCWPIEETEMVPRSEAVAQIQAVLTGVRHMYGSLIIPATMMLLGGILNGIATAKRRTSVHKTIETAEHPL